MAKQRSLIEDRPGEPNPRTTGHQTHREPEYDVVMAGGTLAKRFAGLHGPVVISYESIAVALSLVLMLGVLVYQLLKSRLGFRYDDTLGQLTHPSKLATWSFLVVSVLLTYFVPRIVRLSKKSVIALIIVAASLALSVTYTYMNTGIDWHGLDVPQDSYALALDAQRQGAGDFVATYNDRGDPGPVGSSAYANSVHGFLRSVGLEKIAGNYWLGTMDTSMPRPFMHPPTFFLVLAAWLDVAGSSPLSATIFMWLSTALFGLACYGLLQFVTPPEAAAFLTLLFITLPTTIQDTWFPTYDVLSGLLLVVGYGLLIRGTRDKKSLMFFLSGLALGASVMFRLTSSTLVILIPLALLYFVFRRNYSISTLLFLVLGMLIVPIALFVAGYNPILTVVTAKFRQDLFYGDTAKSLLKSLPVLLYLGVPLVALVSLGILRYLRDPDRKATGLLVLLPLVATFLVAITTRLTPDFHRNMVGISACLILVIALLGNWPKSPIHQSLFVGLNLAFVALTTML